MPIDKAEPEDAAQRASKGARSARGGARAGAGRKKLIGAKTTTVILTESLLIKFKKLGGSKWMRTQIRLAPDKDTPPPAKDRFSASGKEPDLNRLFLDPQEESTVIQAPDNAMNECGIRAGDTLIVKKGFFPRLGQIALLPLGERLTLRRLSGKSKPERFVAESSEPGAHPPLELPCPIIGTVTYVIRHCE